MYGNVSLDKAQYHTRRVLLSFRLNILYGSVLFEYDIVPVRRNLDSGYFTSATLDARLAGNDALDVAHLAGLDAKIEGQVVGQHLAGQDL